MNSNFCTFCGKKINPNEKFCTSCGAKIYNTVNDHNPRPGNKSINNDTLKMIGICSCIALVIAICVVAFNLILRLSGNPSVEKDPSPQASAPVINSPDSLPEDESLLDETEHNNDNNDFSFDENQQDSGIDSVFSGAGADSDFILAFSSERALTDADLEGLSVHDLRIARNEIFARHGRMFANQELNDWFNSKEWYRSITPKYTPDEFNKLNPNPLSRLENENIQKIIEYEG